MRCVGMGCCCVDGALSFFASDTVLAVGVKVLAQVGFADGCAIEVCDCSCTCWLRNCNVQERCVFASDFCALQTAKLRFAVCKFSIAER